MTEPPGAGLGPQAALPLAAVPGVRRVEPLQHRFAYVGADLQDLYGVRPASIAPATALQDSYFVGGTAAAFMRTLAAPPDSILVSAETVKDYQLTLGDTINLRLVDARTGSSYRRRVPIRGRRQASSLPRPRTASSSPTPPTSPSRPASDAVGSFLVEHRRVQHRRRRPVASVPRVGDAATVTDIATTRGAVGSSLTAVDLAGLTRVELDFALVLARRRRRSWSSPWASPSGGGPPHRHARSAPHAASCAACRQRSRCARRRSGWSPAPLLAARTDARAGQGAHRRLRPAPRHRPVPWTYLAATATIGLAALGAAVVGAVRHGRRPAITVLRDL